MRAMQLVLGGISRLPKQCAWRLQLEHVRIVRESSCQDNFTCTIMGRAISLVQYPDCPRVLLLYSPAGMQAQAQALYQHVAASNEPSEGGPSVCSRR
jgi:hypothetical protein